MGVCKMDVSRSRRSRNRLLTLEDRHGSAWRANLQNLAFTCLVFCQFGHLVVDRAQTSGDSPASHQRATGLAEQ